MSIGTGELKAKLQELEAKKQAYGHAMGVMQYDAATVAPAGSAENRGRTMGLLSEVVYGLETGEETGNLLRELDARRDELDPVTARSVAEQLRSYEKTRRIPMEEYVGYTMLLTEADYLWHKAKETSDWALFEPCLSKIVAFNRKYAGYLDPEKQPYDALLDEYERGLTMADCDRFFGVLKERLVPLIHRISEKGSQPRADFLHGCFPIAQQKKLSDWLMSVMGIDRDYCAIGETEHPFTTNFSKKDVRITTHYYESDPASSMFSVIHEGGHALYELHTADEVQGTCLANGVSMGIHESQSRFYENLLGRSRAFSGLLLPKLQELFPGQLTGVSEEELYRAINVARPSLIRIEADELTYCLHIIIRYEIEKLLIQENLDTRELPAIWNRKVKEYLGLEVPDDKRGVLQDSHWSGGAIGYFPSYALGSAYGAQMMKCMKESVDVDAAVSAGDFGPINRWLEERIWKYGSMIDPKPLLEACVGGPFDPTCYTDYLTDKFTKLYEL